MKYAIYVYVIAYKLISIKMTEINTLEDLILRKLVPQLKQPKHQLSQNLTRLVERNLNLDMNELSEIHRTSINNSTSKPIIHLVYSIWLHQALYSPEILQVWHDFIIQCLSELKTIQDFKINPTIEHLISLSISKVSQPEIPFSRLLCEFSLLMKLYKGLNYDSTSELSFITSQAKVMIISSLGSYEGLIAGMEKIVQGESIGLYMESTKYILGSQALDWIGASTDPAKSRELQQKMRTVGFSNEILREIAEGPTAPTEAQSTGPLQKIQVKYMNKPDKVQISVWECSKQGHSGRIAAKICKARNKDLLADYFKEAEILRSLSGKNENFLEFYDAYLVRETLYGEIWEVYTIEMEFIERTLKEDKERRENNNNPYSQEEFFYIFTQLLNAFNYLKTVGIMHRDIKPSNILISNEGKIKIIDFNVAKENTDVTNLGVAVGAKDFMAPEVRTALETPNTKAVYKSDKSDVFSLGMTLLSLVTLDSLTDLNLKKNQSRLSSLINSIRFSWFIPVLRRMLDFDYNTRINMNDLLCNSRDGTLTQSN